MSVQKLKKNNNINTFLIIQDQKLARITGGSGKGAPIPGLAGGGQLQLPVINQQFVASNRQLFAPNTRANVGVMPQVQVQWPLQVAASGPPLGIGVAAAGQVGSGTVSVGTYSNEHNPYVGSGFNVGANFKF
jgi:hypothetical protein